MRHYLTWLWFKLQISSCNYVHSKVLCNKWLSKSCLHFCRFFWPLLGYYVVLTIYASSVPISTWTGIPSIVIGPRSLLWCTFLFSLWLLFHHEASLPLWYLEAIAIAFRYHRNWNHAHLTGPLWFLFLGCLEFLVMLLITLLAVV